MKVPLSWLKEYIPTKLSDEEIAEKLTVIGLEVEGIEEGILEVALTPNLAHCASVRGIARELAAVTGEPLHLPRYAIAQTPPPIQEQTSVTVENPIDCPRYACRLITGVKVGPSPAWLKEKVELCGLRSVNAVVDITNFVLLELGHPLHAFDFDKLQGKRLVVRHAHKNESIVTLDGKTHYPNPETLLICDAQKPVALAGVMGSLDPEVSEKTTSILLEGAYFDPTSIRRAAKRLGVHSEASYRFERGVDPNGVIEALERATALICEVAHGTAASGVIDIKQREFPQTTLSCRLSRLNHLLGTHLAMGEVETIFRRLGMPAARVQEDLITVNVPTYRHDIRQEIDLIEEAARLYGYGNIHTQQKACFRTGLLPHSPEFLFERRVRRRLICEGLQEFLTCDLISPEQASWISTDNFPSRTLIKLLNPRSSDQSVMRPSLLPGMLTVLKYNAAHGIFSVSGFEVGRVHFTSKGRFLEPAVVSIVLTGERAKPHWEAKEQDVDFFDLKGIIENLFEALKISPLTFEASRYANFHPGRQAALKVYEADVGIMGEVHPSTLKQAGLENRVYFAELNLEELHRLIPPESKMAPLPQFPASSRDWTVTLDEMISVGKILGEIRAVKSSLLESVSLLDVYRSDKLGSNLKNVTFRFVYRDHNKTVSLSEVEKEHLQITKNVMEHLSL